MNFLYLLENIRNSVLDFFMLCVTKFGEELIFMLIAVYILWCVDKNKGYFLLFVGFSGIQINQFLKATFRVPRPWIIDPDFKAVEAALPEATGYSFPSGHTQTAVGTYGSLFATFKNKWIRIFCSTICILTPFSRMYLGVHTPLDVGVSFAVAIVLILLFNLLFKKICNSKKGMRILFYVLIGISLLTTFYMTLKLRTSTEENLVNALENFYKMLGAVIGMYTVYELDTNFIKFETKAIWWAQIIKVVLGLSIIMVVKLIGYKIFGTFLPTYIAKGITYLLLVVVAGAVWPLSFKLFAKSKKIGGNML